MAVLSSASDAHSLRFGKFIGLLDTGATSSWVSPAVIDRLGLFKVARERVSFATDERIESIYLFRLGLFPGGEAESSLPYVFAEVEGFRLKQRDEFDVILGMDVLMQTDFSLRRSGSWTLDFG